MSFSETKIFPDATQRPLEPETAAGVRDLIAANIDSHRELAAAATAIIDSDAAHLLREIATQRHEHVTKLQNALHVRNLEPNTSGTFTGSLRRWWLEFRAAVQGGDPYAVLAEAERGEDVIKRAYESVIKQTTGNPINDVLHTQYAKVKRGHDRVRDLRERAREQRR